MNKLELVAKVGEACEFSKKDAEVAVNAVFTESLGIICSADVPST